MIEVRGLTRRYGQLVAVHPLSFDVAAGEVLGFLGPNGAGKTTTMRMLTGALGPSGGAASVAGFDVVKASKQARRNLGYLPEAPPLYVSMRVRDYVDHAARLRGVDGKTRRTAVPRALERAGLTEVSGRLIEQLSKGYRQRVGLAQALVHEPKVLILDEPTSGLDPAQMAEIRALIAELRGEHTIVLSTHLLSEVTASCDRVLILSQGRIVAQGTEEELRSRLGAGLRMLLSVQGDAAAAIGEVPGVAEVTPRADGRLAVRMDEDVRAAVTAAAVPFGLLEARVEGSLEELYLQAVAGELELAPTEEPPGTPAPEPPPAGKPAGKPAAAEPSPTEEPAP